MAGLGFAPPLFAGEAGTVASRTGGDTWDDSWTQKLDGKKFRTVFDAPEINSALALHQANAVIDSYQQVLGIPADQLGLVVVLRHRAIPMAFNDDMGQVQSGSRSQAEGSDHRRAGKAESIPRRDEGRQASYRRARHFTPLSS